MPNKNSAKKALRQDAKRRLENDRVRKVYREAVKAANKAIDAGAKDVTALLQTTQKALDKAAKRGVIKKNTAARKISRLMKKAQKAAS